MSATPPAPAPAARRRPAAAWLAFSPAMTAQVPAIAGRADLTVTVAPGVGRGAPACFIPATAEIEVNGDHLGVDPATANPGQPGRPRALPGPVGRDRPRVRARRPLDRRRSAGGLTGYLTASPSSWLDEGGGRYQASASSLASSTS
jgi:hypothetical protein